MQYVMIIRNNGKDKRYKLPTLEAAKALAQEIFEATGIIIGITEEAA
ncbi:hypothetical protein LAV_00198 [Sphingobium phage Lacusarx]|uniref:Uncharacterized protein n=1 Tax=Sphingobium phage Lacusarx TaxID=1980139 RepID=A0A1W6DXC4_9CAUD|nr:hypothetical protein FDH44_gp105 [Sphingobium phage Lacusarx]ARK07573.1 hypothetical protein LAV_00198 [Sphingobium phage Lacusarx]